MKKWSKNPIIASSLLLFLIFADQFSKYLIRSRGGFYICNENIAWGIWIQPIIFWVIWMVIIFFMLVVLIFCLKISNFQFLISNKIPNSKFQILNSFAVTLGIIFILSGALSNIVDRNRLGCVVDFIRIPWWPMFNFADLFIVLGTIILLAKWSKL